jgi:hypothetical protein
MTILVLNFMYVSLVRGMFSIFDCTANADGFRFLDAEPAIPCDEVVRNECYR